MLRFSLGSAGSDLQTTAGAKTPNNVGDPQFISEPALTNKRPNVRFPPIADIGSRATLCLRSPRHANAARRQLQGATSSALATDREVTGAKVHPALALVRTLGDR